MNSWPCRFPAVSCNKVRPRSAIEAYDSESYDDAFLIEVTQVEAKHSPSVARSPLLPSSLSPAPELLQQEAVIDASKRTCSIEFHGSALPKKLDFTTTMNVGISLPSQELLQAHGDLSQEKALLVLSHFPKGDWFEVVGLEELKKYRAMDFVEVDSRLQQITCCNKKLKIDLDKIKQCHTVFQCEINCEGQYTIKGPFFERTGSPLQRVFGDGGVLRVHFSDMKRDSEIVEGVYRKVAREGLWIGLRHYFFFAYKDPKAKKKKQDLVEEVTSVPKCYFVCTDSLAAWDCTNPKFIQFKGISKAREYMMHISTVPTLSKRFSRLQLALSQTLPLLDLDSPDIKVEIIEDIYCRDSCGMIVYDTNGEKLIHTDGTGFVSYDIARRCPADVFKGKVKADSADGEVPLLLQVRLFYHGMVAKGTLLVNLKLPPSTIQLRQSMVKVKTDKSLIGPCYNSLEVCNTSHRSGKGKLSPYLALLLSYGGVPDDVLVKFVDDELQEIRTRFSVRHTALRALKNSDHGDHYDMALRMLMAGISLDEPYLKKTLFDLSKSQLQELSTGRVTIPDCYNLMGCADPTGMLKRNQVVIVLEHGPVYCSKVLVYKSPGLHVGDVKVFEAVWLKELAEIIGNGKHVIFFSVQGPRSVVDEIANSDLDGDQYWCCTNPLVVKDFVCSEVWKNPGAVKNTGKEVYKNDEVDKQHFEVFLKARFKPCMTMGLAANSWLAVMDKFLTLGVTDPLRAQLWSNIQSLVNTYYQAVDAEKSGKQVSVKENDKARHWPHYIQKKQGGCKWIENDSVYHSTTILGRIYDLVKGQSDSLDITSSLEEMVSLDTLIDKRFQYPGFQSYYKIWDDRFKDYKARIASCLHENEGDSRNNEAEAILQMYRMELYKADTLIDSPVPLEEIYKQASAIYIIVYTHAQKRIESWREDGNGQRPAVAGLQFAWKVAGYALLKLLSCNPNRKRKEPVIVEESVFRDLKFARRGER